MLSLFKKPFHKCETNQEKLEWFKKGKYWKQLDEDVLNMIIEKFSGNPGPFEVFVFVSEACGLVKNNYITLSNSVGESKSLVLSTFALTLYNTASLYRDKLIDAMQNKNATQKEMSLCLNYAMSGYESAIILDSFMVSAYFQLAVVRGQLVNKHDEGIKYCQQGLDKIKELRAKGINELDEFAKKQDGPTMSELEKAMADLKETFR